MNTTYYYDLKKPVTYVEFDNGEGGHYHVSIWVNHGFSGILTIRKDELNDLLKLLSSDKIIYSSRDDEVIKMNETNNLIVISEHGGIIQVEILEERSKQCET